MRLNKRMDHFAVSTYKDYFLPIIDCFLKVFHDNIYNTNMKFAEWRMQGII